MWFWLKQKLEMNDIWWMLFLKFVLKWYILLHQVGEEWDDSLQTKEQIEARLLHRQEAAMRRERALAYAFSHQVARLPLLWFSYFGF